MLRSVKYGLYGVVLAGVVGGTVAWTNTDKTVHLVVDGQSRVVHTTAGKVGDVLTAAGYHVGAHDLLAPAASTGIKNGETIVYKRGRLLHLDVDGSDRDVWTTAPTVALALQQLGYSTTDFTSVSRSRRLPLGPTDIAVRTPKAVTVVHDGTRTSVTSTAASVGQLLSELNISVGPDDRLSAPSAAQLADGETITLQRVVHKTLTTTAPIPFGTTTSRDSSLLSGTTRIVRAGHPGELKITWAAVYIDGKLAGKTKIRQQVVRQPSDTVKHIGTKQAAVVNNYSYGGSTSSGSAQSIARSLLGAYGWGQDQFSCLDQMWTRESGWRTNAYNPSGAYGIPQALPGSKMASAGPDWQTNATTQIKWGLGYIKSRYNSPCQAWSLWQSQGWY